MSKITILMKKTEQYIAENRDRFLEELKELIAIPSISSDHARKDDMLRAADYLKNMLIKAGVDRAEVCPTEGNPIVYAERIISEEAKTVLVYGHYDVMPVEPLKEWKTSPFDAVIKDGAIWARGANDDKGQTFTQLKAFEAMNKVGELPCNVKFMLEGEEEIGSESLTAWCSKNRDRLKADVILVSDTSMLGEDVPSITCGLRGISYFQVKITGASRDLHSGLYGGAVANPINALSTMIGKLMDENGRITIPGFYDDVRDFPSELRKALNSAPFSEEKFRDSIGITESCGEEGYTTMERKGIRPTLDVCGIIGGYTKEGSKTVIPSSASAKISMRLVADQNCEKVKKQFMEYFPTLAPKGVKVEIEYMHGGTPYMADTRSEAYKAASKALVEVFGKEPIPFYSGGSIGIISTFTEVLGLQSILLGFGLDTDAIHAPNENFRLSMFDKALKTIPLFYKKFAEE